jgi:GNAT superfamily N-acetyltransferase
MHHTFPPMLARRVVMSSQHLYECFVGAMVQRCEYVAGSTVARSPRLVTAFTNLLPASSFCFFASGVTSRDDFDARISEALEHGRHARAPWSLGIFGDWLADDSGYAGVLASRGFNRHATVYGMSAEAFAAPLHAAPVVDFRRVTTENELSAVAAINNVAHGHTASTGTEIYAHYLHAPKSSAFVGFVDDEAVTCAAAFPTPQGVYLGGVATDERHRGRGYGEAASRYAIEYVRREAAVTTAILFASRQRVPFYERIGFTVGAELRLFRAT